MDETKQPSAHTVQPASPEVPQYTTPRTFPTPAHPMPVFSKGPIITVVTVVILLFIIIGTIVFLLQQI